MCEALRCELVALTPQLWLLVLGAEYVINQRTPCKIGHCQTIFNNGLASAILVMKDVVQRVEDLMCLSVRNGSGMFRGQD